MQGDADPGWGVWLKPQARRSTRQCVLSPRDRLISRFERRRGRGAPAGRARAIAEPYSYTVVDVEGKRALALHRLQLLARSLLYR